MKKIILLRHAKSSWASEGLDDHERPLNARGMRDAPEMARRLKDFGVVVDEVRCSSALRTRQTAELMQPILEFSNAQWVIDKNIYLASVNSILGSIAESDADSMLVLGHNPGLEDLCERLSPGAISHMPTCAYAIFTAAIEDWRLLQQNAVFQHYDFPKSRNS